jgi:hypothetical protein
MFFVLEHGLLRIFASSFAAPLSVIALRYARKEEKQMVTKCLK